MRTDTERGVNLLGIVSARVPTATAKSKGLSRMRYPVTPDGRYFAVRGRLWRTTNPDLSADVRDALTRRLMAARRAVGAAKRNADEDAIKKARRAVDRAKRALGERGPAWWTDGAPDFNRRLVKNTPYADWYERLNR